jgi:hypothetical protein
VQMWSEISKGPGLDGEENDPVPTRWLQAPADLICRASRHGLLPRLVLWKMLAHVVDSVEAVQGRCGGA